MKKMGLSGAPKMAPGYGVGRAVAMVAGLAMVQAAMGVSTVYTWTGGVSAQYNNAGNWNPSGIPDALGEAFELAGGTANMTTTSSVDWFNLQSGMLNIPSSVYLTVATQPPSGTNVLGFGGGGTINLNSTGSNGGLRLTSGVAGDKFVWTNSVPGVTSTINMNSATTNLITGTVSGLLFVNQALVQGSGQVGVNLLNIENAGTGVIQSINTGSTLSIDPVNTLSNDGVLRSSAGVLRLLGATYNQTANGVVELVGTDAAARIELDNATLVGGTLRQTAFGANNYVDMLTNSRLDGVNINAARIRIPNGNTTYMLNENVLTNGATIFINSIASGTSLQPPNGALDVVLSGTGGIVMTDAANNILRASTVGQTFTNNLGAGIVGSGQIGNNSLVVTNNTFIESNGAAGINIDPPTNSDFVNNGTLRAINGSTLSLVNGGMTNNGTIAAIGAGSTVLGSAMSISGGTLASSGGGEIRLQAASLIEDTTLATGSLLRIPNAATLSVIGTFTLNGTLMLDSVASTTAFNTTSGDVIINGTGQFTTSNALNNNIGAASIGQRMTFNNTGGYSGSGQIGLNNLVVTNNTTIAAAGSTGLRIDPPTVNGFTNNGIVRANTGSALTILSGPFDNTNGVIDVQSGASATLTGVSITGGLLQGTPTGGFTNTSTSQLTNVEIAPNTTVTVSNASTLQLAGTIELNGVIAVSSIASLTDLRTIGGDVVINGDGQITMSDGANNYIRAGTSGQRFTFNNAGGVRGSGQLGADSTTITNNTTIASSGASGLRIDPVNVGGMINNGIVLAETDSNLTILGGPFDNENGVIRLQPNSTATLNATTLSGGVLEGATGASFIATATPTISDLTIDGASLLRINNAQTLDIAGGIVNNGEIRIDAAASTTSLRVNGSQTMTGSGSVTLTASTSRILASVSNQRLTIEGITVGGIGQLGVDTLGITNRGAIIANGVGTLTIDPPAGAPFINDVGGLLHVNGANVTFNSGGFNNTGGTIIVDATRKLDRTGNAADLFTQTAGLTLVNGEFEVDSNNFQLQGGTLAGSGNTTNNGWIDSNLTNTGGVISPGETANSGIGLLTVEGTFIQSGNGETRIEIAGPTSAQHDKVVATGAMTLGGRLRVVLLPGYDMMIGDSFDVIVGASRAGEFDTITVENLPFLLQFNVEMLSDRVRLVAAERCLGDYDLDGGITGNDIAAFFADFELGSLNADLDQDGGITGGDIAEFFNRFENGC